MSDKTTMFHKVERDPEVRALIRAADERLRALGFNEHGARHVNRVANAASTILRKLGFDDHVQNQARIAGLLHDIGNAISREHHASTGARLAHAILSRLSVPSRDITVIIGAIESHGDNHGSPGAATDAVSAALILADKSDVYRSRVRGSETTHMDLHDRVGYSVISSRIRVDHQARTIRFELVQDPRIATEREFLDLFDGQLTMCRQAAELLACAFTAAFSEVAHQ